MKNLIFIIGLCLFLSACVQPITYMGDRLRPTNSIDVFYSAILVKKEYKVIGHLESHYYKLAFAKQKFINKSKRIGADAIIILNVDTTNTNRIKRINADVLKYD